MNRFLDIALGLSVACTSFAASADKFSDQAEAETRIPERWECKYCLFEENQGVRGEVEVGAGYVSEDSFKQGDHTGLNEQGAIAVGAAKVEYQNEHGQYWGANAEDLGLESRALFFEAGKLGHYGFELNYSELPKLTQDTTVTPFLGVGSERLVLPTDWVAANSTAGMTTLVDSLHAVDIEHKRKRIDLELFFKPKQSRLQYQMDYAHEQKQGIKVSGGAFGVDDAFSSTTSLLLEPIDYVTDMVELAVAYTGRAWQAKFGYLGSFFKNEQAELVWQNPFADPTSTTGFGRISGSPDNEFHQVFLSTGIDFFDHTRVTLYASAGKALQDESFLPVTTNATLAATAQPRRSLDGEVDLYSLRFSAHSSPFAKLRFNARYSQDRQDNKTPQASYNYVITDTQLSTATRTNMPYSYTKQKVDLDAHYRVNKKTKLSTGYEYQTHERTFQEVDETEQNTLWVQAQSNLHKRLAATLKLTHSQREGSEYATVTEIVLPENPLLRKYHLADRDRNQAKLNFSILPTDRVSMGLNLHYAQDDYKRSRLGLLDSKVAGYGLDAAYLWRKHTNFYAFFAQEYYRSEQAGSQSYANPDWLSVNRDRIDTVGLGIKFNAIEGKLDIGADYAYSRAKESMRLTSDNLAFNILSLPDATTHFHTGKLYGRYALKESWSLSYNLIYENYTEVDYAVDNIAPNSYSSALLLGAKARDYEAYIFTTSLQYRF